MELIASGCTKQIPPVEADPSDRPRQIHPGTYYVQYMNSFQKDDRRTRETHTYFHDDSLKLIQTCALGTQPKMYALSITAELGG